MKNPLYIPIPFLSTPTPLGQTVTRVTSALGIRPCAECKKRAERLDQAVTFVPMPPIMPKP